MNNTFTCTFFGHRDFNAHFETEKMLEEIIRNIILENEFTEFLVGMNGEFDRFVSSVIRRVKKNTGCQNAYHILVLPYASAEFENNKNYYLNFYDEVEYCEESASSHFKSAIGKRNCYMIDRADLVICFVHKKGGAFSAMEYATKNNKPIINLYRNQTTF